MHNMKTSRFRNCFLTVLLFHCGWIPADNAEAAHPSQQAYVKASKNDVNNWFGYSAAVDGDTMVIGTPFETTNGLGAAYVFVRSGTNWIQEAYLKASNAGGVDAFGISVAVSGDTVVVGARGEESNATGVNGDQSDNSLFSAGAAYSSSRSR